MGIYCTRKNMLEKSQEYKTDCSQINCLSRWNLDTLARIRSAVIES